MTPIPDSKVTPFFDAESEMVRDTDYIVSMEYTPYSTVSFRMTLSDLE